MFPCVLLSQETKEHCLKSIIRFDNSSIEKLVMHPEDVLAHPDLFWATDSAYQLVKRWHQEVSVPVSMEKWKKMVRAFKNLSIADREKNRQLIAARKMMSKEKEFNEKAMKYLCSFLPVDCPDISTTIYFTTAIMASGFQMDNNIVIYGANADKDNLLIHELFHKGFNKCKPVFDTYATEDSTINQIYNDLQNEGMATYVGYKGLKEFPNRRTDLLKDDYKMFENPDDLKTLLNNMNILFEKAPSMAEKERRDALWQLGSIDRAYYVVGCFMAKTIDDNAGRAALVATIRKGSQSFLNLYNSLVDKKLKVYDLYKQ